MTFPRTKQMKNGPETLESLNKIHKFIT